MISIIVVESPWHFVNLIGNSGFVVGDDLGMRQSEDARS